MEVETRSTLYINWEKKEAKNRRYTIKKIWANNKYDTIPNKCAFHAFLYINYDGNFFIFYFQINWDSYYQTKEMQKQAKSYDYLYTQNQDKTHVIQQERTKKKSQKPFKFWITQ